MIKNLKIYLILAIFLMPAIWSLIPAGFFHTHDGAYHLIRLAHFYTQLTQGQLPVRWADNLAFGFGYPLFNYVYPLLYYLGSLIHFFGLSLGDSLKLVVFLATLGSILTMYLWLRCHFEKIPSLVGAIFYIYTPFRFLITYVTGSYGTVLTLFLVPLILFSLFKLIQNRKVVYLVLFSFSLAGFLLSHNVTALMFLPLIATYTVYLLLNQKNGISVLRKLLLGTLLGLGLAAFFILPAWFEKSFVRLGNQVSVNYQDHFPTLTQLLYSKWGYGYSVEGINDGISFQVGIAQWLVTILSTFFIIISFFKKSFNLKDKKLAILAVGFLGITIFFMLKISDNIWSNIFIIQQIQFPWRLLAVSMFLTSFLSSWLVSQRSSWKLAILFIILVVIANRNHLRPMEAVRYPDSNYLNNTLLYNGSADIAWEALPIWVQQQPAWFASSRLQLTEEMTLEELTPTGNEKLKFRLNLSKPREITINKLYFPSWHVKVDSKDALIKPSENYGLIQTSIPQGMHIVVLKLKGTTLEGVSNLLSLTSLIILLVLTIFLRKSKL